MRAASLLRVFIVVRWLRQPTRRRRTLDVGVWTPVWLCFLSTIRWTLSWSLLVLTRAPCVLMCAVLRVLSPVVRLCVCLRVVCAALLLLLLLPCPVSGILSTLVALYILYVVVRMIRRVLRPQMVKLLFSETERNRYVALRCVALQVKLTPHTPPVRLLSCVR